MIDRRVFRPVLRANLIKASMFSKAKYLPDDTFDKLKAHLVAGLRNGVHQLRSSGCIREMRGRSGLHRWSLSQR